jgi:DNA-binding transcriptional LysR family regulator
MAGGPGGYHQHPMKLDPVSLRLFVAVMEESTIAAAAAREHLAASAVSRRLADLEARCR